MSDWSGKFYIKDSISFDHLTDILVYIQQVSLSIVDWVVSWHQEPIVLNIYC